MGGLSMGSSIDEDAEGAEDAEAQSAEAQSAEAQSAEAVVVSAFRRTS
jgi:hypothetical protein